MIRLTTLGRLDLTGPEGQAVRSVLQQPKRLALLVYLALEADGGFVRRETLLGLFWPEHDEERARNALNQALHYLRRSLGKKAIVSRGTDDLGIADGTVACDAIEFQRLLDAGDRTAALALYRGDFLRGFYIDETPEFERWQDRRRSRLRTLAARAAWGLADDELQAGNDPAAVHWGRRAAEFSPYDEPALRRLIRLLDATGDRAGALRAFDRFAQRLAADLDAEPSDRTRALAAAIRSRDGDADADATPADATAAARAEEPAATPSPDAAAAAGAVPGGSAAGSAAARSGATAAAASDPMAAGAGRAWSWPLRRSVLAGLFVATLVVLWALPGPTDPRSAASATSEPTRIAIMRFDDYSRERDLGYLGDALATTLIQRLAAVPALEIVARDDPTERVSRSVGLDSARAGLDIDLIVSGSVMRSGDQIRVSVRLVDAESRATLETMSVQTAYGDLFTLLDDVAQRLSSALRMRLGREIRLARWRAGTDNVEAWELLQRAQWYRDRANDLEDSGALGSAEAALQQADSLLARAEALDSDWIEPAILRGYIAEELGWLFFMPPLRHEAKFEYYWREGVRHASHALRRGPDDATALELRGVLRHLLLRTAGARDSAEQLLKQAERDLRRAVAIDDGRVRAWSHLSSVLLTRGQFSEANLAAERAYRADAYLTNVYEILARLVETSLELNDMDGAARWCDEIRRRAAQSFIGAHCTLSILAWRAPPDSVRVRDLWSVVDQAGIPADLRALLRPQLELLTATALARMGLADSARAIVDRVSATSGHTELLRYEAFARTALGQESAAIALLRRYVAAQPSLRAGLLRSRAFDRLRDRADFPGPNLVEGSGDTFREP